MKRVELRKQNGLTMIFEDLTKLTCNEIARLQSGEPITYRRKTYVLSHIEDEGHAVYIEQRNWMDQHPLIQLDKQLRRGE